MRILHIAATLGRGGIATSLWHLLPSLAGLPGNEVNGAIFYEKGWFGELLEAEGIKLQHLHMDHKYDPWVIFKLVRLQKDYDVVHAHGWPIIFFVALASLVANRPVYALTEHSVTNRRRRPVFRWLDRFIYSRFDRIVAVSQAVAESLADWQPQTQDKITVIYNSIQMAYLRTAEEKNTIRQRLNLDEQTPVIFASGNFRLAKGFDLLLQSMVTLLDKYRRQSPDNEMLPVLVITGEGELQNAIVELAMKLGIRDQVRFLGFRTDMPHILNAADLFVLSSRWEGCPMVVLESMALGIPILATNVGGVPELVEDNQTGKLIPPGNPTALANGMYELLRDRKQAECLADEGQQRLVQKFEIEANAQRMTTMYRQAMGHLI
jgi:glycosyltransferase involved in cell wall biosynthesis